MTVAGKVAIVTGAARGIGFAISQRLAEEGAAVVASDRDAEAAQRAAGKLADAGYPSWAVEADVRSKVAVHSLVEETIRQFGCVDILVNNAGGGARHIGKRDIFHSLDLDSIDWLVDVNLRGVLYCSHAVIGHMMEQESGRIVNISSIAGVVGGYSAVTYSAAKGGVNSFTKSLAIELGSRGITVNAVSPGAILSIPQMEGAPTYVGRGGQPEEVANLVHFLCTDEAGFITGHNHVIDGGRSLGPLPRLEA